MKKTFLILFLGIFIFNQKIYALSVKNILKNEVKPTVAAIREQTREEIRERLNQATTPAERNEIKNKIREENKELLDQIKNQIKEKLQNLRFPARISGKITEKGESFIKVEAKDEKIYQVVITKKTQLRRRFWGKSNLSEFSVGDEVNVIGRYTNEEKTIIDAVLIRNLSIQRRWGVFFGEVTTISQNYLIIKTLNRGNLAIYLTNETKLKNRREKTIKWNDIQVGHKIRVKGVWDNNLKEIREVEEVKDFSIPPIQPTITQSP